MIASDVASNDRKRSFQTGTNEAQGHIPAIDQSVHLIHISDVTRFHLTTYCCRPSV